MGARRIYALMCVAGAVMILIGVIRHRFWTARITTPDRIVDVRIGLTGLTGCTHDAAGVWRCDSVEWKELGVTPDSALWVWSGRLLFGVGIAMAIALAIAAVLGGVPIELASPVSPARVATALGAVGLVLLGLYRLTTPDVISILLSSGSGWLLVGGGLVVGGTGAFLGLQARDDD